MRGLSFFPETGSNSICGSGYSESHYADQAGLKFTELCLPLPPSAGIKGVYHYSQQDESSCI